LKRIFSWNGRGELCESSVSQYPRIIDQIKNVCGFLASLARIGFLIQEMPICYGVLSGVNAAGWKGMLDSQELIPPVHRPDSIL
jgi:hypothetical protein